MAIELTPARRSPLNLVIPSLTPTSRNEDCFEEFCNRISACFVKCFGAARREAPASATRDERDSFKIAVSPAPKLTLTDRVTRLSHDDFIEAPTETATPGAAGVEPIVESDAGVGPIISYPAAREDDRPPHISIAECMFTATDSIGSDA